MLPWGGHRVEAHLHAGETAQVFLIEGASGATAFIEVVPDDGSAVPPAPSEAGAGEQRTAPAFQTRSPQIERPRASAAW